MPPFDNTYTDSEFTRQLDQANSGWMAEVPRGAPDLEVDGLTSSLLSRILSLFSGSSSKQSS